MSHHFFNHYWNPYRVRANSLNTWKELAYRADKCLALGGIKIELWPLDFKEELAVVASCIQPIISQTTVWNQVEKPRATDLAGKSVQLICWLTVLPALVVLAFKSYHKFFEVYPKLNWTSEILLKRVEEELKKDSTQIDFLTLKASILYKQSHLKEALILLQQVLDQQPDHPHANWLLDRILSESIRYTFNYATGLALKAQLLLNNNEPELATIIQLIEASLKINPHQLQATHLLNVLIEKNIENKQLYPQLCYLKATLQPHEMETNLFLLSSVSLFNYKHESCSRLLQSLLEKAPKKNSLIIPLKTLIDSNYEKSNFLKFVEEVFELDYLNQAFYVILATYLKHLKKSNFDKESLLEVEQLTYYQALYNFRTRQLPKALYTIMELAEINPNYETIQELLDEVIVMTEKQLSQSLNYDLLITLALFVYKLSKSNEIESLQLYVYPLIKQAEMIQTKKDINTDLSKHLIYLTDIFKYLDGFVITDKEEELIVDLIEFNFKKKYLRKQSKDSYTPSIRASNSTSALSTSILSSKSFTTLKIIVFNLLKQINEANKKLN